MLIFKDTHSCIMSLLKFMNDICYVMSKASHQDFAKGIQSVSI